MEPEGPRGAGKVHRCPERHLGKAPRECGAGHACGDHETPGVLGRGGNGEYPAVALRVGRREIGQNHDHDLASSEFKVGRSSANPMVPSANSVRSLCGVIILA